MDLIDQFILCEFCNNIYDEPHILNCGDTLCNKCIGSSKYCKLCNQSITSKIVNKKLSTLVTNYFKNNLRLSTSTSTSISTPISTPTKLNDSFCSISLNSSQSKISTASKIIITSLKDLKKITSLHNYIEFGLFFKEEIPIGLIPDHIQTIKFNDSFNCKLIPGSIPSSVHTLIMGSKWNQELEHQSLPEGLLDLKFGFNYNSALLPGMLPSTLKSLHLGFEFNRELKEGVLPKSLCSLHLSHHYNHPIGKGVIPDSLKILNLGFKFNQVLSEPMCLGANLQKLTFSWEYNQIIQPNILNQGLLKVRFGYSFNSPFRVNSLPQSIQKIEFGWMFNQPIGLCLPPSLTSLRFGYSFNQVISKSLPRGLLKLYLGECFNQDLVGIPSSVILIGLPSLNHKNSKSDNILDSSSTKSIGVCNSEENDTQSILNHESITDNLIYSTKIK